jgi:hypothetical protein
MFGASARTAAFVTAAGASLFAQTPSNLATLLDRVGERVEQYYSRAQSIVCTETVRMQPLGSNWQPSDRARVLEYELRVTWEPGPTGGEPEANITRRVVKVDGRPPKPGAEPGCMDPRAVSPEPLAMLLPRHRAEYVFTHAGLSRDHRMTRVDYRSRAAGKAEVTWKGECASFSLPGRTAGRVWIDAGTDDVLRLDESLVGMFEYRLPREHTPINGETGFRIERADSTIEYRRVAFRDPDETLLLPERIESVQVVHGASVPRLMTVETFANYRRFVTEGRVVQ